MLIDRKIFNLSVDQEILKIYDFFCFKVHKQKGSKEINVTPSFRFKSNINFLRTKIELVDNVTYDNKSEYSTILKQKFSISTRNKILFFYIFPLFHFKVYFNDIEIGEITIKKDNEKSSRVRIIGKQTKHFIGEFKINELMLDDWFTSHVANGDKTNFRVYMVYNKLDNKKRLIINNSSKRKITDVLENISFEKLPHNFTFLSDFLKKIQKIIAIIIIVSTVFVISDAIWEKISKKNK